MPADDAPDPAPAQAAGHSPPEPTSPPAPNRADAPRPRRRAPGPARRRAASTGFLLGSLAALGVTVVLAVVRHRQMPFTDFSNATSCIVYGVLGGLILLPALAAVEQFRTVVRCIWAILFLGACVPAALPLRDWWKIYRQTTVPPHYLAALAAAYLAAGLLIVHIFRIASVRFRRRAERPARSVARGAARRHRRPPAIRLLLRGLRRRLARPAPAPRVLAVGAVGFLVPVLACTALAVLPSALVRPEISTTAPVPAAIPARPEAVSGEPAWTRLVEDPLDVVAGEAGPVIVQSGAVRGLDPATGAVRWSYERPGADFVYVDWESSLLSRRHIITSPNGRYAALRVGTDRQSALTVVLDTRTGEVAAEHPSREYASLQLTDTAALDGARAFSLTDGRDLWTLPLDEEDERPDDSGYTGPAGHSTFIRYDDPEHSRPGTWDDLILIPDSDPTAATRIDHVLTDPTNRRFAVVDGWTAQLTGDGAQAAEATLAAIREARAAARTARTNSADAEPVMMGWQTQAVNIDALAGSAAEAGTAPVPMGIGSGINSGASLDSGDLCLVGQHPSDLSMENLDPGDDRVAAVSSLLDTATRTVRTPETDPGLASAEVGIEATVHNGSATSSVVVRPGNGGAPISAPIGEGSSLDPSSAPDDRRPPAQQLQNALTRRGAAALAVPGATLLIVVPSGHPIYSTPAPPIRIYAVPGGFP